MSFRVAGFMLLLALSTLWPISAIRELVDVNSGYPYAGNDPSAVSEYGFRYRSCTDYVAWYLGTTGLSLHGSSLRNGWDSGRPEFDDWSDPGVWHVKAMGSGFTVDHLPAVGAVAQWTAQVQGGTTIPGHVAIVTHVNADNTVDVFEYDFASPSNGFTRHAFGIRTRITADHYLHLERNVPGGSWDSRTPPSGTMLGPVTLAATVRDNGNGGLDYVQITASESTGNGAWTGWRVLKRIYLYGAGRGTISVRYAIPVQMVCARVSFDVFSRNRSIDGSQARQLSPHGYRRYGRSGASC